MCNFLISDTLNARDLTLSFVSAQAQKVHFLQHDNLQISKSFPVVNPGSGPAVLGINCDCHLYDCWPLAGHEE